MSITQKRSLKSLQSLCQCKVQSKKDDYDFEGWESPGVLENPPARDPLPFALVWIKWPVGDEANLNRTA